MKKKGYIKIHELDKGKQRLGKIIAVMNNKGGCGKTSLSMNLITYLARRGYNVLGCDMDPQHNLTQRLGIPNDMGLKRIDEFIEKPERKYIIEKIVKFPHLSRIRGSEHQLGKIGIMPGAQMSESEATHLKNKFTNFNSLTSERTGYTDIINFMSSVFKDKLKYFDYIILDTAPALQENTLNVTSSMIADEIIFPIDSLEAMTGINESLNWIIPQIEHRETKPNGTFAMVKYQMDTKDFGCIDDGKIKNVVFRSLQKIFKEFVCEQGVKELRKLRLSKKASAGFGGKTQYTMLCEEIIEKINKPNRPNMFEFVKTEDVTSSLEKEIASLLKTVTKWAPIIKDIRYILSKEESDVDE